MDYLEVLESLRLLHRTTVLGPDECWTWRGSTDIYGYGKVRKPGDPTQYSVTRLIYEAIHGPILGRLEVTHTCNYPTCCNPKHLKLGTHLDNMQYMVACNRSHKPIGEKNGRATVTEDLVRAIRKSNKTQAAIAAEFGITRGAVCHIRSRYTWAHVE